jgi:hypothetical protein
MHHHRAPRGSSILLGVVLVVSGVLAGTTAATAAPAAAPGAVLAAARATFGIQPSSASGTDGRSSLSYVVSPGAEVVDHVAVLNYGLRPITVAVYAADAVNDADGAFDLAAAGTAPRDAGAWIVLGRQRVRIPGRAAAAAAPTRVIVPVTVSVPTTATPGDHAAGIVAVLASAARNAGAAIRLEQRVGVRAFFRVGGTLRPGLAVEDLSVAYHSRLAPLADGSATIRYVVHNTGNVKLGATQAIDVRGWFGADAQVARPAEVPLLLPGARLVETVTVEHVRPALRSQVTVTLTPVRGVTDTDPALHVVTATTGFWTVPWTLVGLVLLVVAAAAAVLARRRASGPEGEEA